MTDDRRTPPPDRLKLAYLVARFPKVTETFVARELNAVAADPQIDVELFSLFPARDGETVHPSASSWVARVRRPGPAPALGAALRWFRRRPLRTASSLWSIAWGFRRRPDLLPASLSAFVLGCAHAETMEREGFEHMHAHFVGNPGTAAWTVHRLTGIGYSATVHAYELFQDKAFLCRRVADARFVVTISEFNASRLRSECPGVDTPIHVIRAGVDLDRFGFHERTVPAGTVRAITVGSLMAHKGHRVLLEALADPRLERVRLSIVGDGDQREALQAHARSLGVAERVTFRGSHPEDEVAEELEASDVFVSPSLIGEGGRMEGVPVVLMEALASGLPAVATRMSGVPELVRHGETGLLSEQGDVASLRDALLALLDDYPAAVRRAGAGRRLVETEFDVTRSAATLATLFAGTRAPAGDARRPAFVAWTRSDRAPELADAVGADAHVVFISALADRRLVLVRYLLSAILTAGFLVRHRPPVIVATNPPIVPPLLGFLLGRLWGAELILDSHPRGFGLKQSTAGRLLSPLHRFLMRRARVTLVAGPSLAATVLRHGGRALIVHEAPPAWRIDSLAEEAERPTVLWVSIFATDEPVVEVLEAARRLPEVDVLITGDPRRCPATVRRSAPANVTFIGFWPADEFRQLIERSQVLLVLSTEPASVPRAAFEAVEARRPLVLSRWPGLAEVFPGAILVDNDAEDIARGVRAALSRLPELTARFDDDRTSQRRRWSEQRTQLMDALYRDGHGAERLS